MAGQKGHTKFSRTAASFDRGHAQGRPQGVAEGDARSKPFSMISGMKDCPSLGDAEFASVQKCYSIREHKVSVAHEAIACPSN